MDYAALHMEVKALHDEWWHIKDLLCIVEQKILASHGYYGVKGNAFNLVEQLAIGETLLVGEGNLSFTRSLVGMRGIVARKLIATTFESQADLLLPARNNAKILRSRGVSILHGIDATKLAATFVSRKFDNIVFQFPHTGSREAVEGHNPNFILVRDFLKSAYRQLANGGQVYISAVDSPHYSGAFHFDEAAEEAGFQAPTVYPFDPSQFPHYEHTMTPEWQCA